MARRHVLVIASVLGLAAVVGVVALGSTLGLGAASTSAQNAAIVTRTRQLDRFDASLRRQLAAAQARPVPPRSAGVAQADPAQRVVYVRPAPIVVHKHRTGGDYEHEGVEAEDGGTDD